MMEDSTLHHVYNTPWALPCTVLSRSWSILRDFIEAGSDLGSISHDSHDPRLAQGGVTQLQTVNTPHALPPDLHTVFVLSPPSLTQDLSLGLL